MPEFIRISRDQYDDLLAQLDGLAEKVQGWCPQPQVDGQLELPLEWDESRAGR